MGIPISLAIIALAALIHASFQLSISVLTLLSGHTIGSKRSHSKLLQLTTSFVVGSGTMTILLISFISLVLLCIFGTNTPQIMWSAGCGLLIGVAISVWLFYYRRQKGTVLWIPRGVADYLVDRTKSTKLNTEAFGLGLVSIIGELLFIIAPLFIGALTLIQLPTVWHLIGIGIYAIISLLPLLIVWSLIGSGHKISRIQKWREDNKYFLQFAAGAGLVTLSFFVFIYAISSVAAGGL